MGTLFHSKTLRPYIYAETVKDCHRTMCLLWAWAIWRSRWAGWAAKKASRLREVERMEAALEADLRKLQGHAARPLLGSDDADRKIEEWVPQLHRLIR